MICFEFDFSNFNKKIIMKKYFFIAVFLNFFSINAQNKIAEKVEQLAPEIESQAPVIESEVQQATSTVTTQLQKGDGATMLKEAVKFLNNVPAEQRTKVFANFIEQITENSTDEWRGSGGIPLSDGSTAFIGASRTLIIDVAGDVSIMETDQDWLKTMY
jgi:hypothetical protein